MLALVCSAAAKHAISSHVPLPPSNPFKNAEEKKLQNSNASVSPPSSYINLKQTMSALGHKQTLRQVSAMSALAPKADIGQRLLRQSWRRKFDPWMLRIALNQQ
jgi:hypothetical protein